MEINRTPEINEDTIVLLNAITQHTRPQDVVGSDELDLILNKLLNCKGIGLSVASAILHFYNPTVFPIIDQEHIEN